MSEYRRNSLPLPLARNAVESDQSRRPVAEKHCGSIADRRKLSLAGITAPSSRASLSSWPVAAADSSSSSLVSEDLRQSLVCSPPAGDSPVVSDVTAGAGGRSARRYPLPDPNGVFAGRASSRWHRQSMAERNGDGPGGGVGGGGGRRRSVGSSSSESESPEPDRRSAVSRKLSRHQQHGALGGSGHLSSSCREKKTKKTDEQKAILMRYFQRDCKPPK